MLRLTNKLTRRELIGLSGSFLAFSMLPIGRFLGAPDPRELASPLKGDALNVIAISNSPQLKKIILKYLRQNEIHVFDYDLTSKNLQGTRYFSTECEGSEQICQRFSRFNSILARIARRQNNPTVALVEVNTNLNRLISLSDIREFGDLDSLGDVILSLNRRYGRKRSQRVSQVDGMILKGRGHSRF